MAALPDEVEAEAEGEGRSWVWLAFIPDDLDVGEEGRDIAKLTESIERVMPGHLKDLIEKVNINSNDDVENEKITCVIADISLGWYPIEVAENIGI